MAGFTIVSMVVIGRFRNIAVPHWEAEREASAGLFGFLEERLGGTEDIRANGARSYVMHHFYRLMQNLMTKSVKAALMVNIYVENVHEDFLPHKKNVQIAVLLNEILGVHAGNRKNEPIGQS